MADLSAHGGSSAIRMIVLKVIIAPNRWSSCRQGENYLECVSPCIVGEGTLGSPAFPEDGKIICKRWSHSYITGVINFFFLGMVQRNLTVPHHLQDRALSSWAQRRICLPLETDLSLRSGWHGVTVQTVKDFSSNWTLPQGFYITPKWNQRRWFDVYISNKKCEAGGNRTPSCELFNTLRVVL